MFCYRFSLVVAATFLLATSSLYGQVRDTTLSIGAVSVLSAVSGKVSYQGFIEHNGSPANGLYDFELRVYNALAGGTQQGSTHSEPDAEVTNGVVNIEANFGSAQFWKDPRYIQVGVRPGASVAAFEVISPRAEITATPLALALPGVYANPSGSFVGIGRNFTVGAESFGVHHSVTGTGFGGMYVNTAGSSAKPFYGYSVGNSPKAWTLYDGATQKWELYNAGTRLVVQNNGNVGIGVTSPLERLHVDGADADVLIGDVAAEHILLEGNVGSGAIARFYTFDSKETVRINSHGSGAAGQIILYSPDGVTKVIDIEAAEVTGNGPQITLFNGNGVETIAIDGDFGPGLGNPGRITVDELELNGADLAENFDIRATALHPEPTPGLVVSIDPDHPGELMISYEEYDTKVVGVISGAGGIRPGIYMSQKGTLADGAHPVAIAGRTYVMADASNGPIAPGDLLTTSTIPGHAMKAGDHERARGAILGKAMTALESGTGLVLLFVSQQ